MIARLAVLLAAAVSLGPLAASAQQVHDHSAADHQMAPSPAAPLGEMGNAAFAAVREVVDALNADPDTDWSRVDLEALRLHLVDMQRFTLEAEVVRREEIEGGLRVVVRGTSPEANASIKGALHAHGPMLGAETGWNVTVRDETEGTLLEVTGQSAQDVARIRGLGYIGLMATGDHHREHHWLIATGGQPHAHEHQE